MHSFVAGKTAFDVGSLAAVAVVLSAVALISAWLPTHRAGKLDPITALREEA